MHGRLGSYFSGVANDQQRRSKRIHNRRVRDPPRFGWLN